MSGIYRHRQEVLPACYALGLGTGVSLYPTRPPHAQYSAVVRPVTTVRIGPGQAVVQQSTLDRLARVERERNAYLYAVKVLASKGRPHIGREDPYSLGYRAAVRDLADAVVAAPLEGEK